MSQLSKLATPFSDRFVETKPGTVETDGRVTSIQEVGECENPNNWKTDGARLKACASDGIKRCAMRLGLGLHLWHKHDGNYVLADILEKREEESNE